MTQINFTLDSEQIQDIISNSGANDLAKQMLATIFNQLMEKERDEYINADSYSRVDDRVSSRNGYYERTYTTRIGRLELIVLGHAMVNFLRLCLNDINVMKKRCLLLC